MIYFLAAVAAIAGLLFGYDEGVIAVAGPSLERDFPMSPLVHGFNTAAVPLGAMLGAILAGRLAERFGRRHVLMIAAALFALGALGSATSGTLVILVLTRLVLGLAIGIAAVVAPMYIAECAPMKIRGALVSTYQLAITAGIVLSYLTGLVLTGDGSWRVMFGLGAIPGVVFLVGLIFLPESPRWLMMRNRDKEAVASLRRLRGPSIDVTSEAAAIRTVMQAEASDTSGAAKVFAPWIRPALVVGVGLFFLQQLSGINAVIYYAPTIFASAGLSNTGTQVAATIGVGVVNLLVTILAMALIDRVGRRPLLIAGFTGTATSLLLIAAATVWPALFPSWFVVAALMAYIASFAISLGPLPHLMMSEVFPLSVRGSGMSISSVSNWGFNFLVVFLFPVMLNGIGLAGAFTIFGAMCVAGIFFTLARVPETKGISLERIEAHLHAGQRLSELRPSAIGEGAPTTASDRSH